MNWTTWINRPLRRYMVRASLIFLNGRRWSHRQDWWPGLALELPTLNAKGAIRYKGKLLCEIQAWNTLPCPPDELTIVGSGPSAASQVFSHLPPNSIILLNGAIHLLDGKLAVPPYAIIIEDERFVWRHFDAMRRLVLPKTLCLFSTSVLRAICEIDPEWLTTQKIYHADFVQKPYDRTRRSQDELERLQHLKWSPTKGSAISLAPTEGFFAGGSVAVTAMQLALHLRPPKIGLAGIDLSNANDPRFYEATGTTAKSGIVRAQDRILAAFAIARNECRQRGIDLVNYSPVSALSTIDIPYDNRLSAPSYR